MNVYNVHFRDEKTRSYSAFGYTLQDGKYFFHKQLSFDDFDSFAKEIDVIGIDNLGDEDELYKTRGGGAY